ncbi:ABC transporter permease subunit [Varunaivibrio sulfuroxidans]|uniref:Putrescine transport system permease protein n=1 Tax=Varunaivibrio sulfuroxidans TaxID=1773489 RepID=A0A4R3JCD3_9PROT|nr:ABC transporter permease subunit [Varunaivibrio sulfuroxidans]TCS63412.1 putrescine transport system permease protein [Varunaivibrio sulfuroxidans]WES30442.1 ABC transporter permease subunit [Varunaivibrio sulfuroxidans]
MPDTAGDTPNAPRARRGVLRALIERHGRKGAIAVPYLWLVVFFLVPFLIVAKISLSEVRIAIPPYGPLLDVVNGAVVGIRANFNNYTALVGDALYWKSYLSSLEIASLSTLLTLLVGYPIAYAMARAPRNRRAVLLMMVILPFWSSFLIRVYAWIGILKDEGYLNHLLLGLGIIHQPLNILHTYSAVYIGIVYSYLPFMVLPLYANLEKMDWSLLEAAADLGCAPLKAFWKITVPLSMPGIVAGCFLVFIPAVGEFVIPDLLGGSSTLMIGKTLWVEFFNNRNWPLASAVAIVLLLFLVGPILLFQRLQARHAERNG